MNETVCREVIESSWTPSFDETCLRSISKNLASYVANLRSRIKTTLKSTQLQICYFFVSHKGANGCVWCVGDGSLIKIYQDLWIATNTSLLVLSPGCLDYDA